MISEQEFLFNNNVDFFCKKNNIVYPILMSMIIYNDNYLTEIYSSFNLMQDFNEFISELESKKLIYEYNILLNELNEKVLKICKLCNFDYGYVTNKIYNNQDLLKRLYKNDISNFEFESYMKRNLNDRYERAMLLLDKGIGDVTYFLENYGKTK